MIKDNIKRIKEVAEMLEDDDPDKVEMLNIEGDYNILIKWALTKHNEHILMSNGAKDLATKYSNRSKSFKSKAESMRGIIEWIMQSAGETKFVCAAGTASQRKISPKPIVTENGILPEKYIKVTKSVDKALINSDIKNGVSIDGVSMDNGGVSLTIRV